MIVAARHLRRCAATAAIGSAAAVVAPGCEPYRVEYHTRPSFYQTAADARLPDRLVQDDGTVIVYNSPHDTRKAKSEPQAELLQIWEEEDDGTIILRSLFPDHVISNAMSCIRLREWEVMWSQLISSRSRDEFLEEGKTYEDFVTHLEANRDPLMEMFNRMRVGYHQSDVLVDKLGGGAMRLRLSPHIAGQFAFQAIELVPEGGGLRLYSIR